MNALTRQGVLEAYTEYKYEQYKNSRDIPKKDRDAFTTENAQQEIVADFFAEVLFQGEKYRSKLISALENVDGEALNHIGDEITSEAALMEIKAQEPKLFEHLVQFIKEIADKLRNWSQGKTLVNDLDNEIKYLERMVSRVYNSNDSKLLIKKKIAPNDGVEYKLNQENKYDYSKSFSQQVDDYKSGKIPNRDTLLVGGTPEVYLSIGLNALPNFKK